MMTPPDVALEPHRMDAPRKVTKDGAKLISISCMDLFQRTNYQDFARYNETDMAIAGDAEADAAGAD